MHTAFGLKNLKWRNNRLETGKVWREMTVPHTEAHTMMISVVHIMMSYAD
jgi:hypothetical protein